jgi:hypothetical protein
LESVLEPYKNNPYIPSGIIQNIIKETFPQHNILHNYSEYHKVVKILMSEFLCAPILNWKFNRPPDKTRCHDIAMDVYTSKNIVETMFYLSFNHLTSMYEILDGIHRYTALKIIQTQNSINLDLLHGDNTHTFGSNCDANWLYNSYVFVNIRFNSKEGELIDFFKTLNKSNPVPEIYIRDVGREKREIIESIVNEWQVKYNKHFSSNSKPNKPNVNRDRFIDLLDELYDRFQICLEKKHILQDKLNNYNTQILFNHNPKKLTQKIREKCSETNCWLFIYSCEELSKMIK